MRRQPRSRFLRSVIQTAAEIAAQSEPNMPWARTRAVQPPKDTPAKVVQFRRA